MRETKKQMRNWPVRKQSNTLKLEKKHHFARSQWAPGCTDYPRKVSC
jgi:hypothetical protein